MAVKFSLIVVSSSLMVLLLTQPLRGKPLEQPAEEGDEFAKKAADALDATILSLKDGLNTLIEDSRIISNVLDKLATDILSHAPHGKVVNTEESKQRLQALHEKANRTLYSDLFKMDDDDEKN